MADTVNGDIKININLNSKGLKVDIKKLENDAKNLAQQIKKQLDGAGDSIESINILQSKAMKMAIDGLKKIITELNEYARLYGIQEAAEYRLAAAAKNNPYLNDTSVVKLRNYAHELQMISVVADQVIIDQAANLARAGRSESEIMKILAAAIDLSAGAAMEFDAAVAGLNITFSGTAGELKAIVPELGQLTAEELKAGEAADLVRGKFDGMGKEFAQTREGEMARFNNAVTTLKENIGEGWEQVVSPFRQALTEIIEKMNTAQAKQKEFEALAKKGPSNPGELIADYSDEAKKTTGLIQANLIDVLNGDFSYMKDIDAIAEFLDIQYRRVAEELGFQAAFVTQLLLTHGNLAADVKQATEKLKAKYDLQDLHRNSASAPWDEQKQHQDRATAAAANKKSKADDVSAAKTNQTRQRDEEAAAYIQKNEEALKQELERIRLAAAAKGEEADRQAVLNAHINAYIALIAESNGLVTENNQVAQTRRQRIEQETDALKKLEEAERFAAETRAEIERAYGGAETLIGTNQADLDSTELARKQYEQQQLLREEYSVSVIEAIRKERDFELDAVDETLAAKINSIRESQAELARAQEQSEALKNSLLADASDDDEKAAILEQFAADEMQRQALLEQFTAQELALIQNTADEKERINQESRLREQEAEQLAYEEKLRKIQEYANAANSILSSIHTLATTLIQNELEERIAALDTMNLTDEERAAKIEELNKVAAEEKYKLDMFMWGANLLTATANAALAVITQFAQGGWPAAILAGITGALQVAIVAANKPKKPSFAQGGIVPGRSYSGDNVEINANSGEMVLNNKQQKALWEAANGGTNGSGMNVVIHNNAANLVESEPSMSAGQMELYINAIVEKNIGNGNYNNSFRRRDTSTGGMRIL
ncbi:hypothetical protein [Breznakiella homolactica]|uniref:Uncharacterized protein n=1 Tax=Breznakiella homolactica TaxID=2798577 RepID=A0A7T7XPM8_9SPIR|nr:hypothetical protein [Breznakiella homolactica]QQO10216.1 hypothetical protein JFL75_04650 [Breznakiella homolactica]